VSMRGSILSLGLVRQINSYPIQPWQHREQTILFDSAHWPSALGQCRAGHQWTTVKSRM